MGMMYPNRDQKLILMPATDLEPYEAGLVMPDAALQSMVLNFAEQAARLYALNSGATTVPERFIQVYCATALMKMGFIGMVEINHNQCREWFGVDDGAKAFRDLLIFDPSADGNPDNATLRGVVEFKVSAWHIQDDILRTRHMVNTYKNSRADLTDEEALAHTTFGLVVVCGYSSPNVAAEINEIERMAARLNAGKVTSWQFNEELGNGSHFESFVAGVPV